jgi:hypothetical protein
VTQPPPPLDEVEIEGVRFVGAFRPTEREFLAAQFGACAFRLLARSAQGADLALVEWEAGPPQGGGPSPLSGLPRRATYILDASGAGSAGGGSGVVAERGAERGAGAGPWAGLHLERVDGPRDLATRYPGHFPDARLRQDWRDRLRRAVQDVWPALMVAVATIWVLAVVWACRPFS